MDKVNANSRDWLQGLTFDNAYEKHIFGVIVIERKACD